VLENAPLLPRSAKAGHVAGLMAAAGAGREAAAAGGAAGAGEVRDGLATVLRDHSAVPGGTRPGWLSAACVHGDGYGTRSAMIVTVRTAGPPQVQVADGPSCQAPLVDVAGLWAG
jgi:hypothetical protein